MAANIQLVDHRDKLDLLIKGSLRSVNEGSTADVTFHKIPQRKMVEVFEDGFAFGSPRIRGSRYIATGGVRECIVLISYNLERQVGFMAHLFTPGYAKEVVHMAQRIGSSSAVLFGGSPSERRPQSMETIDALSSALTGTGMMIVGLDLLRYRSCDHMAIDTKSGKILVPHVIKIDSENYPFPGEDLSYEGGSVAPIEAFYKLVPGLSNS